MPEPHKKQKEMYIPLEKMAHQVYETDLSSFGRERYVSGREICQGISQMGRAAPRYKLDVPYFTQLLCNQREANFELLYYSLVVSLEKVEEF